MKHFNKKLGVITRECSKCGCDLGDRYGKQRHCKSCHAAYMRANRVRHSDLTEEQRKKANARSYANQYLKRGLIQRKNCEVCNSPKSQMHHDDYNKPTQVRWFCRTHHLDFHKNEIGLLNNSLGRLDINLSPNPAFAEAQISR